MVKTTKNVKNKNLKNAIIAFIKQHNALLYNQYPDIALKKIQTNNKNKTGTVSVYGIGPENPFLGLCNYSFDTRQGILNKTTYTIYNIEYSTVYFIFIKTLFKNYSQLCKKNNIVWFDFNIDNLSIYRLTSLNTLLVQWQKKYKDADLFIKKNGVSFDLEHKKTKDYNPVGYINRILRPIHSFYNIFGFDVFDFNFDICYLGFSQLDALINSLETIEITLGACGCADKKVDKKSPNKFTIYHDSKRNYFFPVGN